MAVFMLNICKFDDCGIRFPSLADLILHIEDTHIDYDPAAIEQKEQQQPQCLPLSYVLKFYSNSAHRESQIVDLKRRLIQQAHISPTQRCPSEQDDEELATESEDSNESWTTSEDFSPEYILKHGSRISNPASAAGHLDKPFVCPVPGCKKRYKNVNGIKYHSKNGHKKDGKIKKAYKCHCGKSYKTAQGLKNHSITQHLYPPNLLNEVQNNQLFDTSRSVSQHTVLTTLKTKCTDPKTIEAIRIKSENKKLISMKIRQNQKILGADLENDFGILTPATSPDASPNASTNLPLNTSFNSIIQRHMNSGICDTNHN